ncbi:hypothetical protein EXX50_20640, partial [Escherichia coli]
KSAQIREILISESAWEEMTCLFAPSLTKKPSPAIFVNDWHNGVISRLIMVKKEQLPWSELKKLTIRTWHLLICHILI